jgi:hypothetical protein
LKEEKNTTKWKQKMEKNSYEFKKKNTKQQQHSKNAHATKGNDEDEDGEANWWLRVSVRDGSLLLARPK